MAAAARASRRNRSRADASAPDSGCITFRATGRSQAGVLGLEDDAHAALAEHLRGRGSAQPAQFAGLAAGARKGKVVEGGVICVGWLMLAAVSGGETPGGKVWWTGSSVSGMAVPHRGHR